MRGKPHRVDAAPRLPKARLDLLQPGLKNNFSQSKRHMAMFNWLSKRSSTSSSVVASAQELRHIEQPTVAAADPRKQQRLVRREQLYLAIREAMTQAGVRSSGYKFKVLLIDQAGDEFLVMIDLAHDFVAGFDRVSAMEAAVVAHARSRFDIAVPAVYWRRAAAVAFAAPAIDLHAISKRSEVPAVKFSTSAAAPAVAQGKLEAQRRRALVEEEMAAVSNALLAASSKSSSSRVPDFADTEMVEPAAPSRALGTTQYGDFR